MASPFTEEELAELELRREESRQYEARAAFIAPIAIIFFSTALRLWAKRSGMKGFSLDDGLIILASISAIGMCISGLAHIVPYGLGRHVIILSEYDIMMFAKGNYIFSHFYNVSLGSAKLSVLAFYYSVFSTSKFRKIVIFSGTFVALWLLAITLVLALQCRPIEGFWDATVDAQCFDLVAFTYFTNITNLVTDIWIFLLPIPIIVRLHITSAKKAALCAVFLVGLGVCIITAVRLEFAVSQGSPDFTWELVPLGALSAFEAMASILCANLPMIYPLFLKTTQKLKSFRSLLSNYTSAITTTKTKGTKDTTSASENAGQTADSRLSEKNKISSVTIMTKTTTTLETSKAFDCESPATTGYVASATARLSREQDEDEEKDEER